MATSEIENNANSLSPCDSQQPQTGWQRLTRKCGLTGRPLILWVVVGVAILAAVTFWPALDNEFVYDDWSAIVSHPSVTQPGPWYRFWHESYYPRSASPDKLYRPLTVWSFRMNTAWSGHQAPDPWSFHIVNLVLHVLTSIGVALLAYRLTGRITPGWVAGILFATHPIHTETVVTGYGRSELLAGLFGAWLIARHIRPADPNRPRSVRFHIASTLLFLAAIMSKEHAVFLWPALFLIDLAHRQVAARAVSPHRTPLRKWFNRVLAPSHLGFAVACTTFFLFRFALFGQFFRLENSRVRAWDSPMAHASLVEHLLTPFRLLWLTAKLLVLPDNLCPIWSVPALPLADHLVGDVLAGMLLLTVLILLAAILYRYRPVIGALVVGMLLVLAMPLQALPLAHWLYAERWLYLPTVFMAALVGVACSRLGKSGAALALAIALILLPQSWQYSSKFHDNETMHREVICRHPNSYHGWRNFAVVSYYKKQYVQAVQAANEMIERFGPVADAYRVLYSSYLELGDGRRALEAIDRYEEARRFFPEPSRTAERRRAQALIEQERQRQQRSRPADSAPAAPPTQPTEHLKTRTTTPPATSAT